MLLGLFSSFGERRLLCTWWWLSVETVVEQGQGLWSQRAGTLAVGRDPRTVLSKRERALFGNSDITGLFLGKLLVKYCREWLSFWSYRQRRKRPPSCVGLLALLKNRGYFSLSPLETRLSLKTVGLCGGVYVVYGELASVTVCCVFCPWFIVCLFKTISF